MSSEPQVSILIPSYKSGPWVEQTIGSALGQTFRDLEVVVCDDASPDDTVAKVRALAERDSRVRLIENERNLGPVLNWHRTAQAARGKYSALLFADDWYEPEFIERLLPRLESDVAFAFCSNRIINERDGGTFIDGFFGQHGTGKHSSNTYLRGFLSFGEHLPVSPGCAVTRTRDLIRALEVRLPCYPASRALSHGAGPDVVVGLWTASQYPYVAYVDEPLVNFRLHQSNLFQRAEVAAAYELCLNDFYDCFSPAGVAPSEHMARRLFFRLRHGRTFRALGRVPEVSLSDVAWSSLLRHTVQRVAGRARWALGKWLA
ncbi:MAG TPA: glycosyltransferase family 2 protein [Polyangiaceae bacterium]|jgi:glycosyltransferase involved in cell wall biosynthesis|nr:glycosyltransferase family 2 protein [Polyangiaceae bacterium]